MMDVEKLIEQLRDKGCEDCPHRDTCRDDDTAECVIRLNAATALSTLQDENEEMRAELEQVKIERDAAVSDLEHIMSLGGNMDTCQLCGNAQCHKRGGTKLCLPKWRGQKED